MKNIYGLTTRQTVKFIFDQQRAVVAVFRRDSMSEFILYSEVHRVPKVKGH